MIQIKDKEFVPYISAEALQQRIKVLGEEISRDFEGETPVLLGILNGSFMFASDLVKSINTPMEITFLKIASYEGQASTGKIKSLLGLDKPLEGRSVIIVEDIVDTGLSMTHILEELSSHSPKRISIAALLVKPDALQYPIAVDYVGFEIPNKFVVGYGLDYDGLGRNIPEIYQLK